MKPKKIIDSRKIASKKLKKQDASIIGDKVTNF
jgi:hypothetical protein